MLLSSLLQLLCPFLFSQPGWREVPYDRPVVGLFILKLKEDDHKMVRRRDRFERNYSFWELFRKFKNLSSDDNGKGSLT